MIHTVVSSSVVVVVVVGGTRRRRMMMMMILIRRKGEWRVLSRYTSFFFFFPVWCSWRQSVRRARLPPLTIHTRESESETLATWCGWYW